SDSSGHVWTAGDPVGYRASLSTPGFFASPSERRVATTAEPSPLTPLDANGAPVSCPTTPSTAFQYVHQPNGTDAYLWSSIGVCPGPRDAVAGGQMRPGSAGGTLNDDGQREPLLERVGCTGAPVPTRFRMPDPFNADQAGASIVPVDRTGTVTSVA